MTLERPWLKAYFYFLFEVLSKKGPRPINIQSIGRRAHEIQFVNSCATKLSWSSTENLLQVQPSQIASHIETDSFPLTFLTYFSRLTLIQAVEVLIHGWGHNYGHNLVTHYTKWLVCRSSTGNQLHPFWQSRSKRTLPVDLKTICSDSTILSKKSKNLLHYVTLL